MRSCDLPQSFHLYSTCPLSHSGSSSSLTSLHARIAAQIASSVHDETYSLLLLLLLAALASFASAPVATAAAIGPEAIECEGADVTFDPFSWAVMLVCAAAGAAGMEDAVEGAGSEGPTLPLLLMLSSVTLFEFASASHSPFFGAAADDALRCMRRMRAWDCFSCSVPYFQMRALSSSSLPVLDRSEKGGKLDFLTKSKCESLKRKQEREKGK